MLTAFELQVLREVQRRRRGPTMAQRIREGLSGAWFAGVAGVLMAGMAHAEEVVEALPADPASGLVGGALASLGIDAWLGMALSFAASSLLAAGLTGATRTMFPALKESARAQGYAQGLAVVYGVALGLGGIAPPLPPDVTHLGAKVAGGLGVGLAAPVLRDLAVRLWRAGAKRLVKHAEGDEGER